jgi:hypothetical protein
MNRAPLALAGVLLVPSASAGQPAGRAASIGYCTALANLDAARAAGFDDLELRTSEIAALPGDAFEARSSDLATEAPRSIAFLRGALER